MSATRIPSRLRRLNKVQKISVAGVSALGVAALTFSLVPSNADAEIAPQAAAAAAPVALAFTNATGTAQAKTVQNSMIEQHSTAEKLVKAADAAKAKAAAETKAKAAKAKAASEAKAKAAADAKDKAEKAAKAKADAKKRASEKANRSTPRKPVYANNLDGWIREAMSIMKKEGIPGSYEGIHRNIIRESSGNRWAINNWDINAQNGIPSKGLLQVIQPTFDRYHVAGTKKDLYDPVANIVAACNYAADRYGSMDNVDSAY
ncbi:transglycosylase SLT domain-containing protein [Streptomyces sp. MBT72]|uniref:transglycosylase SLT domain-containing protein n=1 Tax=Streptomyces sp. MBT72 TaxID=1488402 RepID=UPI001916027A|nr:transglycosylase SLT domain-containing protein [Streptomyces sp. MBT72]MBK3531186.1 transglycosylase SLT domain-containing protein [Streptomyces sp. MBT72]